MGRDTNFRYLIDQAFIDAKINRQITFQTNHYATACALVAEGAGLTVVDPFSALAYFRRNEVVLRPFVPTIPFQVNLITPVNQSMPLIVEEFLVHLSEEQKLMTKRLKDLTSQN